MEVEVEVETEEECHQAQDMCHQAQDMCHLTAEVAEAEKKAEHQALDEALAKPRHSSS